MAENCGAEFSVDHTGDKAGKKQNYWPCGPEKYTFQEMDYFIDFSCPRYVFTTNKIDYDKWVIADAPGPAAKLFVLAFQCVEIGFAENSIHVYWAVDVFQVMASLVDEKGCPKLAGVVLNYFGVPIIEVYYRLKAHGARGEAFVFVFAQAYRELPKGAGYGDQAVKDWNVPDIVVVERYRLIANFFAIFCYTVAKSKFA